jgi:hypothetical protein
MEVQKRIVFLSSLNFYNSPVSNFKKNFIFDPQ